MNKPFLAVLLAVLATGLIAAGCGGGGDETTSTTSTTTEETGTSGASGATGAASDDPEKAALIEQADAICAAGDKEIEAAGQEAFSSGEPSAQEQEAFVEDTVVPNIQDQLDQLSDLDPPEADAEEFQGIIDDAQEALDQLADDPSAITGQGDDPFAAVNQRAQEFGLTSCGGD